MIERHSVNIWVDMKLSFFHALLDRRLSIFRCPWDDSFLFISSDDWGHEFFRPLGVILIILYIFLYS